MSKFTIIFCVTLVASVICAKNGAKSGRQIRIFHKERCIRDIRRTFRQIDSQYERLHAGDNTLYRIRARNKMLVYAVTAFENLLKRVRQSKSIGKVRTITLFDRSRIHCNKEIGLEIIYHYANILIEDYPKTMG